MTRLALRLTQAARAELAIAARDLARDPEGAVGALAIVGGWLALWCLAAVLP